MELKGRGPERGTPEGERRIWPKQRDCWRCGRNGHKTYECHAFIIKKGTALPKAPWKMVAVAGQKRWHQEDQEEPATKQQKVAALETMDTDAVTLLWEDSKLDF